MHVECPRCGWNKTRPSMQFGIVEALLRAVALVPIRCRRCRNRFYRFAWPGSKLYGSLSRPAV